MNEVIISDTHFYHKNIIPYCNRPFADEVMMSRALADNINASLPSGGRLYHVGDWAFGGIARAIEARSMINPGIEIYLIQGNHDRHFMKKEAFRKLFDKTFDFGYEFHWYGQRTILCHYSMELWHNSHHGSWHIFGHSHNSLAYNPNRLSFDGGVDAVAARLNRKPGDYRPFTFEEARKWMAGKTPVAVDHHNQETQ